MTVLAITITDPSPAFSSKAAEVQYLKRVLETFLIEIGRGQGTVTSGSFCPWLDKSLAMGYVSPGSTATSTRLLIDVRGSTLDATVVPLPFYSRTKKVTGKK